MNCSDSVFFFFNKNFQELWHWLWRDFVGFSGTYAWFRLWNSLLSSCISNVFAFYTSLVLFKVSFFKNVFIYFALKYPFNCKCYYDLKSLLNVKLTKYGISGAFPTLVYSAWLVSFYVCINIYADTHFANFFKHLSLNCDTQCTAYSVFSFFIEYFDWSIRYIYAMIKIAKKKKRGRKQFLCCSRSKFKRWDKVKDIHVFQGTCLKSKEASLPLPKLSAFSSLTT